MSVFHILCRGFWSNKLQVNLLLILLGNSLATSFIISNTREENLQLLTEQRPFN